MNKTYEIPIIDTVSKKIETQFLFLQINALENLPICDLIPMVSQERKEKIENYKYDMDRRLSLYSELIVRWWICNKLNINNNDIVINTNKYGKPYYRDFPNIFYNISHTYGALIAAFSSSEIGVDIEEVKSIDIKIAQRVFTVSEQEYIASSSNINAAFYEIWTKKEAYVKFLGKGLSLPLDKFCVFDNEIRKITRTYNMNRYIMSVCYNAMDGSQEIAFYKENDLQNLFRNSQKLCVIT